MSSDQQISVASIGRLPLYLRVLTELTEKGVLTVSSEALAEAAGVQSALLRRDLSQFGSYGTRGVGYNVDQLRRAILRIIGGTRTRRVVIIGAGNLGQALVRHTGFADHSFEVVALIDIAPDLVGATINGVQVSHQDRMVEVIGETAAELAVIATPASAAQEVADTVIHAGITSILNMAPIALHVPEDVAVRNVDFAQELQILSYHQARRAEASPTPRSVPEHA